jgi:hypothetical protein
VSSVAPLGLLFRSACSKYWRISSDLTTTVLLPVPMKRTSGACNLTIASTSESEKAFAYFSTTKSASSRGPAIPIEQSEQNKATASSDLRIFPSHVCECSGSEYPIVVV